MARVHIDHMEKGKEYYVARHGKKRFNGSYFFGDDILYVEESKQEIDDMIKEMTEGDQDPISFQIVKLQVLDILDETY